MKDQTAWLELGLTHDEYGRIKKLLGREPNYLELNMFSAMWSEHCSYKNSKLVLKKFPTSGPQVIQGPGENAGVVDIGDGQAAVFKIESHNHPSAVEPYHAAATGLGGIVRDIFTMGARPLAALSSIRFGMLDQERVRLLFREVVKGIADYAKGVEVDNLGGEVVFHPSYTGNPLVNAMCIGLVEHGKVLKGVAAGKGNLIMVAGAKTGRDGVHGASFASDELTDEREKKASIPTGDPYLEKRLMEACLELIDKGLLVGMQDLGAAGLTSSCAETASRGGSGLEVDISLVPCREERMNPYEIMISESQERMLLIVEKKFLDKVNRVLAKWEIEAAVIGKVTADGCFRVQRNNDVLAEIPVDALTEQAPVYERETREPAYFSEAKKLKAEDLEIPKNLTAVFRQVLGVPTISCKNWVYEQFDTTREDQLLIAPGADAGVLKIGNNKGLAAVVDCNARYCYLDPYEGGKQAVAEAARNLVCVGATPLAFTDCLNFGNPEDPEIFWQFKQAVEGMSAAARILEVPVVSGNVSFYNESRNCAIYPTPVVGMVGVINNCQGLCTPCFKEKGDVILLFGETKPEIGGSEYLAEIHGLETGRIPEVNLIKEKDLQDLCRRLIAGRLISSAHDCADGGLAVALSESCIMGEQGAVINLETAMRADFYLFSESQARVIVSVSPNNLETVQEYAEKAGISYTLLGYVNDQELVINYNNKQVIRMGLEEMKQVWSRAIALQMD